MEYDPVAFQKRLKDLYPAVDESDTPLPRKWSAKDKYTHLTLQLDGLKVHYQGQGKNHKDAGSVRAVYPIPVSCGIYYFEVKVISKGRDGYLGIGLSAQGTNLNRLPGWEKLTYGYHGDDGHKFYSTGNGQPYGPTFTTGDVIGCCLNLINYSCFYTKNGIHIGEAFQNLPNMPLYPTVGLQTPNEQLLANFGQHEFVFNFADYINDWRNATHNLVYKHLVKDEQTFSNTLNELVQRYLIHHGYVGSIEAFHKNINTGESQIHQESLENIKSRQCIKNLVLAGRIGEAINCTNELFPGILSKNATLLFSLKVRQFIEMVNGTDSEVEGLCNNWENNNHTGVKSFTSKSYTMHHAHSNKTNFDNHSLPPSEPMHVENSNKSDFEDNDRCLSDNDMETDAAKHSTNGVSNGVSEQNDCPKVSNGVGDYGKNKNSSKLCGGNPIAVRRMVEFGQKLLLLLEDIKSESVQLKNRKVLLDAYSLLAYTDPWNSPVGYQLDPLQREPVFASLNSAILKSQNLPTRPPIQTLVGQTKLCLKKMLSNKIGTAAFVSVSDYLS